MSHHVQHSRLIFGVFFGFLILVGVSIFAFTRNGTYTTHPVSLSPFVRTVTVIGEVVPRDEVTLAFTTGGRVASLSAQEGAQVSRGQILASLDTSEIEAGMRQAVADKRLAQAELNALVGASDTSGRLEAVKREAVTIVQKALTVADTQIKTNTDILFTNPASGRPQVTFAIRNYFTQQAVNQKREEMTRTLKDWQAHVDSVSNETITQADLQETITKLVSTQEYFDLLGQALSDAEVVSGVTEARISEFRNVVSGARASISSMINEVLTTQESLRSVFATVPVQEARIASTQASIDRYQALLNDRSLASPFAGIITNVFVTAGEIIAPNQAVVSLMSEGTVMLEAFIPEVNIAHVQVGDQARVQFDAYGNDLIIGATVSYVDAQATSKNGVATYKTLLEMNTLPQGIRAGMTATIAIDVTREEDKIIIPKMAVTLKGNATTVRVLNGKEVEERAVEIGRTDTQGGVEILEGLSVGDIIILSDRQ